MSYRVNAKQPEHPMPEIPQPRWHRRWIVILLNLWFAYGLLRDLGVFEALSTTHQIAFWWLGLSSVVVAVWNINRVRSAKW